jgi:hypothetical protein
MKKNLRSRPRYIVNLKEPDYLVEFDRRFVGRAGAPNTDFFHYEIRSSSFTYKTSGLANEYGRQ